MKRKILTPILLAQALSPFAHAATPQNLTLQDFLTQVTQKNTGVQGAELSAKASELKSADAQLLTAPILFATLESKSDAKISPFSFLQYNRLNSTIASLGVSKTFSFGMQAKLHYDLMLMMYDNAQISLPGLSALFSRPFNLATPVLELSQGLWGGGFGKTIQATQELSEAQNNASRFSSQFQNKSTLVQAELTYWRLAAARQVIEVQSQAIDRARKIYEWNQNRVNLHLGDEADAIQAQALLEARGLDVVSAQTEERAASRAFNSLRNTDSESVEEALHRLELDDLEKVEIPKRMNIREDLQAAQELARVARANSVIQTEKTRPNLELYGNLSLNGQPQNLLDPTYQGSPSLDQTLGLSFAFNRPTYTLGVRFSMPLDFGSVEHSQEGWLKDRVAAELSYERKAFEQDQAWKDLMRNFEDTQKHLKLSQALELTQKKKLEKEKDRLKRGRTTTFQVLNFEQDYLFSQLGRIKDQIALLTVMAQMKLFGESK